MMTRLLLALPLLLGMLLPAQAQISNNNRQYFDHNWETCEERTSSFYRIVMRQGDTAWRIGDFYRFAGIQMVGLAKRSDGTGRIGTWTWFHPNGQKSEQKSYTDESVHGVASYWHDNGQLKERGKYSRGKAEGIWKKWHPNGQLADSSFYREGKIDGVSLEWHPNGQMSRSGGYNRGLPVGIHRRWYESGTLEGETIDRTGGAPSTWTWYDRSGRKTAVETYDHDRILNPLYYEPDGSTHSDTARANSYGTAWGSDTAFNALLRDIKYPSLERNNSIEGIVVLKIQILEDGSIGTVEIDVPATPGMNAEAMRAIRALRPFSPAKLHNKPWSFYTTLPIRFTLTE
jgi:TonB family protein